MNKITTITDDANQTMILKLDDGTTVDFTLTYSDQQQGWFYNLTYGNFSLSGRRIVNSPNLLRAYRQILPFGIAVVTTDEYEPIFLEDFKNKRALFFMLNPTDIIAVEEFITSYA